MNYKQLQQRARDLRLSVITSRKHDVEYARENLAVARKGDYFKCAQALAIVGANYEVRTHYITVRDTHTMITMWITVKSLKDELMLNTLEALEILTHKDFDNRSYTNEWTQSMTFSSGDLWDDEFSVRLECDIATDSPTCRKVVVGEKLVIEKQYELQCD